MKNTGAKILLIMIVGSSLALPLVASAWTTPNLWGTPPGFWGPLVSCTGIYVGGAATNVDGSAAPPPCTSLCDLIDTAINIIYFGMSLAIFILAPIMIVVGAVMIMLAGANPGMLESGKKALTATVIGLIIVLCAYLIVNTTITVLGITGIGGFGNNACSTNSGTVQGTVNAPGSGNLNQGNSGNGSGLVNNGNTVQGTTNTPGSGNINSTGDGSGDINGD